MTRLVLVLLLVGAVSGCRGALLESVPDELVGVWKTTSPRYEDRFFEISEDLIVFGTGGRNTEAHPILSIREALEDERLLYAISYESAEGEEYGFFFYYDPAGSGVIRFKNQQDMAWTAVNER